jgi:hypothetical protein|tara:strand:+ start:1744 stop:1953 length:210 start_codon:yes stop_codon:yes gene_type:complete
MSANIPYTKREMQIIKAIHAIDPSAEISIRTVINNRIDYKYGGVVFLNCEPIPYEEVMDKIDEEERRSN